MSFRNYNPPTPFEGTIPGGMPVGSRLRVTGRMNFNEDRFVINLQCFPNHVGFVDLPLHISVRPGHSQIVRNNYHMNQWGPEETDGECIIFPGQSFEVMIRVEQESYHITVNGRYLTNFRHRMSPSSVQRVHIHGAVDLDYVGQEMF